MKTGEESKSSRSVSVYVSVRVSRSHDFKQHRRNNIVGAPVERVHPITGFKYLGGAGGG